MNNEQKITEDNFIETLLHNGFVKGLYNIFRCNDIYEIGINDDLNEFTFTLKNNNLRNSVLLHIYATNFNLFIKLISNHIELKPLPAKEFDFRNYLLSNGFTIRSEAYNICQIITHNITIKYINGADYFYLKGVYENEAYEATKENADRLIAAAKLFSELEK